MGCSGTGWRCLPFAVEVVEAASCELGHNRAQDRANHCVARVVDAGVHSRVGDDAGQSVQRAGDNG